MEILEDRWLSGVVGKAVFKIEAGSPALPSAQNSGITARIRRHAAEQQEAMYYAKVDAAEVDLVRQMIQAGLYVVDVNVTLSVPAGCSHTPVQLSDTPRCVIGEIVPGQHEGVLAIAGSAYRYSRFHLDPLVPQSIAHQIKRAWIHNYIRKQRGEKLWVASVDGRPVGFLAVLASEAAGKRIRTIDLIAVEPTFQNKGVGKALVAHFLAAYQHEADVLQVGTQVANIPSLRLYQKLGFLMNKAAYVLHMHVPQSV
jgi:GNAT superfamily N-acetyltransferase